MSQSNIFKSTLNFFLYLFLQVVIFRNFNILDTAYCFVYVNFILLLPFEISSIVLLILAFAYGFVIDIFYNTLGVHMSASVALAFLRLYVINLLTPRGGYDASSQLTIGYMGIQWMGVYCLILIFAHHIMLFILESWGFGSIGIVFLKSFFTTLLTVFVSLIFQYLTYSNNRKTI